MVRAYPQNDKQSLIAQNLCDLGVDVIIGGHPHVIQRYDTLTASNGHQTLCLYSMGNELSNQRASLMDEDGNRYPLRSAEGIALDTWVQSPESGVTDFTMHFEPLPKKVQIFDFIEGDVTGAFKLLGIHDKKYKIKFPTIQELSDANPWTVPQDWFKSDTITIKGRIEGFNAERLGFDIHAVVHDRKHHSTPFVDGISFANASSITAAWRRLRATDLNIPSMI